MKLLFNVVSEDTSLSLLIKELQPETLLVNENRAPNEATIVKRTFAYTAFITELLFNYLTESDDSYHQMSKSAFSGRPFGYDIFKKVVDACCEANLITVATGKRIDGASVATTFHLSVSALDHFDNWLKSQGNNAHAAFVILKPSIPLIRAKYQRPPKIRGVKRPAKEVSLKVLLKREDIKDQWRSLDLLNDFYAKHDLSGARFCGLQRIYNNFSQKEPLVGGRLYPIGGSYQTLPSRKRKTLQIDGEPVCELDIKSSHLVLYAFIKAATSGKPNVLTETESPYLSDPYSFDSIPRAVVKAAITLLIGSGTKSRTWTDEQKVSLLESEGIDLNYFKFKDVKDAILERYGFLLDEDGQDINWAFLQVREADAVYSAVRRLAYEYDVPAYPVHDSIIIKISDKEVAKTVLRESFESIIGYIPQISDCYSNSAANSID